jgi:hypothetical protein
MVIGSETERQGVLAFLKSPQHTRPGCSSKKEAHHTVRVSRLTARGRVLIRSDKAASAAVGSPLIRQSLSGQIRPDHVAHLAEHSRVELAKVGGIITLLGILVARTPSRPDCFSLGGARFGLLRRLARMQVDEQVLGLPEAL